jgi:hypothetical protein
MPGPHQPRRGSVLLRAALIATTVLVLAHAQARAQCVGDCDGNGTVAVAEIVSGVAIALGRSSISTCAAMDADGDLRVSISELTSAVDFALFGCPPAPTPTATPPSCGDPLVAARFGDCVGSDNEADCVRAGGTWDRYPFGRREGCFCPTGQDGCPCSSSRDCLSFCMAEVPGDFSACADVAMGTCSAITPVAGCFCTPSFSTNGFIALCVDP